MPIDLPRLVGGPDTSGGSQTNNVLDFVRSQQALKLQQERLSLSREQLAHEKVGQDLSTAATLMQYAQPGSEKWAHAFDFMASSIGGNGPYVRERMKPEDIHAVTTKGTAAVRKLNADFAAGKITKEQLAAQTGEVMSSVGMALGAFDAPLDKKSAVGRAADQFDTSVKSAGTSADDFARIEKAASEQKGVSSYASDIRIGEARTKSGIRLDEKRVAKAEGLTGSGIPRQTFKEKAFDKFFTKYLDRVPKKVGEVKPHFVPDPAFPDDPAKAILVPGTPGKDRPLTGTDLKAAKDFATNAVDEIFGGDKDIKNAANVRIEGGMSPELAVFGSAFEKIGMTAAFELPDAELSDGNLTNAGDIVDAAVARGDRLIELSDAGFANASDLIQNPVGFYTELLTQSGVPRAQIPDMLRLIGQRAKARGQ